MAKPRKSLISDNNNVKSLQRDIALALSAVLRDARFRKHLTQQELAGRLGLRQRQISDLERANVDPRLSTIQNVARALDLELMLIPRHLISPLEALQRAGSDSAKRPMYAIGDDETPTNPDDGSPVEVGDPREHRSATEHDPRRRKGRP